MTTILLVEDDPLQASLMMSLLGGRFGKVCRATDAADALCLIEEPGFAGSLSLVISRHHAPGIGGPAFVSELRARMPHLPVLVLGAAGESPADYASEQVVFLPQALTTEQLIALTSQMMTHPADQVA